MSTTVDQRIVEMQFNNKQFESNVSTSMSTIDKLKKALRFEGATKGLESVGEAAKKCDVSPLGTAVDAVRVQFSALEVMAITALQNITNSALNTGKQIVSAFTIDPIKTGFQEYETQIGAIQTILANTSSKGTTLSDVNRALDELNHYADMTIYNFTQMTRNIGTFTAAGLDLDTSVSAIKGIANLAAVSGSTSQQASTAMYQLSQALSSGVVKLQDWNSVVNAGMGGQVFQDALIRTAKVHGIAVDQMIEDEGSFRLTLEKNWLTSDILAETLKTFTGDLTEAQILEMGYTEEETKAIIAMGETANDAATKVKTFTQLFDTLKEAAQSGWTQSWQNIIGDYGEAKEFLTKVSDRLSEIINQSSEARNAVLSGGLNSNWKKLTNAINEAGVDTATFEASLKKLIVEHGYDVDELIKKYGSIENAFKSGFRLDILREALDQTKESVAKFNDKLIGLKFGDTGDQVKTVQTALKELGYDLGSADIDGKLGKMTESAIKAYQAANQLQETGIIDQETLDKLNEATGKTTELSDDVYDLAKKVKDLGGREHLLKALENAFNALVAVASTVKQAFNDIFSPFNDDEKASQLYEFTVQIEKLSEKLMPSEKALEGFKSTLKGLFSVLDIVRLAVEAVAKGIFNIVGSILPAGDGLVSLTGHFGDFLTMIHDNIAAADIFDNAIGIIVDAITTAIENIRKFFSVITESEMAHDIFHTVSEQVETAFSTIIKWVGLGEETVRSFFSQFENLHITAEPFKQIGNQIYQFVTTADQNLSSLKFGFGNMIPLSEIQAQLRRFMDSVVGSLSNLNIHLDKVASFPQVLDTIKNFVSAARTDISTLTFSFEDLQASASVMAEAVGVKLSWLKDVVQDFCVSVKNFVDKNIGSIVAVGAGAMLIAFVKQTSDAMEHLSKAINGVMQPFADMGKGVKTLCTSIGGYIDTLKKERAIANIRSIAISIAILAASVYLLSRVTDTKKLWHAVGAIVALVAALGILMAVVSKMQFTGDSKTAILALASFAISLKILVSALKDMEQLDGSKFGEQLRILAGLAVILGLLSIAISKYAPNLSVSSISVIAMAASLKYMVSALQDIANLKIDNVIATFITLGAIVTSLMALSIYCQGLSFGSGLAMIAIVIALKMFVKELYELAEIPLDVIKASMIPLGTIVAAFAILMKASQKAGQYALQAGVGILAMSVAIIVLIGAMKLLAGMEKAEIKRATSAIMGIMTVLALVVAATKFAGQNAAKAGVGIAFMSAGMLLLAGAILILSTIPEDGLDRATWAVIKLEGMFALIIASTYFSKDAQKTITTIAITIGVLAAAIAVLSLIDYKNPEGLENATNAMVKVMGMLALVEACAYLCKGAALSLGIMGGVVLILAGVLIKLSQLPDIESVIVVADQLSKLMLALSAAMVLVGIAGRLANGAGGGIANALVGLIAAVVAFGVLGTALGALQEHWGNFQSFLDTGLNLLTRVGKGIGDFFGAIVGGFNEQATATLGKVSDNLTAFATGVATLSFGEDTKTAVLNVLDICNKLNGLTTPTVDAETFGTQLEGIGNGIKKFSNAVFYISTDQVTTAVSVVETVLGLWRNLGNGMYEIPSIDTEAFGNQLEGLGKGVKKFSDAVFYINGDAINASIPLIEAIIGVAKDIPNTGGLLGDLLGNNDADIFGNTLEAFGQGIKKYGDAVVDLKVTEINNSIEPAKELAKLADEIPNAGGLLADIFGDNTADTFGNTLEAFGQGLKKYGDAVVDLKATEITNSIQPATDLANLGKEIPNTGGKIAKIIGDNKMDDFGDQLEGFGEALAAYGESVKDLNVADISASVPAGKALADLAKELPTDDTGVIDKIKTGLFGKTNVTDDFKNNLVAFGTAIKAYGDAIDGIKPYIVKTSAEAGQAIVSLSEALVKDKTGKKIIEFYADANFESLQTNLPNLGKALKAYSDSLNGFNATLVTGSKTACTDLVSIANMFTGDDNAGVFSFYADNDMSGIKTHLSDFGAGLKGYSDGINGFAVANFTNSVSAGENIVKIAKKFLENDGAAFSFYAENDMSLFATRLSSFGGALMSYSNVVKGIDSESVSDSVNVTESLMSILQNVWNTQFMLTTSETATQAGIDMMTALQSGIDTQTGTLVEAVTAVVESLLKIFTDKQPDFKLAGSDWITKLNEGIAEKDSAARSAVVDIMNSCITRIDDQTDRFTTAGSNRIGNIIAGFNAKLEDVTNAIETVITTCITDLTSEVTYQKFYDSGKYLVEGFAKGIEDNAHLAIEAAREMASAANKAIENEDDIDSPSKVTRKLGNFVGMGFVNGIRDYADKAYSVSEEMAASANSGLGNAISKIRDAIDGNIDTQPTIRPVLDLSDVEEKSLTLGTILSSSQAIHIGASMDAAKASQIQNGDVSSSSGNSFNFTQNNYSPKALSRIEIYRQTRNQFSAMGRMVNT